MFDLQAGKSVFIYLRGTKTFFFGGGVCLGNSCAGEKEYTEENEEDAPWMYSMYSCGQSCSDYAGWC